MQQDLIKGKPKMVHCEFAKISDLNGEPISQIQIARAKAKQDDEYIYYTIRPKLKNKNKSAVAELVFGLKIGTSANSIDVLHIICKHSHEWFVDELNKIIGANALKKSYSRGEMDDTIKAAFNSQV